MDYSQEQADELEALSSIFADDLEGGRDWQDAGFGGRPPWTACAIHVPLPPFACRPRRCPAHCLYTAELRDGIPSGWIPQGPVWRVVIEPQQDEGEEALEVPRECRQGAGGGWVGGWVGGWAAACCPFNKLCCAGSACAVVPDKRHPAAPPSPALQSK